MEEKLYTYLHEQGIIFACYEHEPAFTCDQMGTIKKHLPEHGGIKNLFLKDKKKRYYLLSASYDTKVDLKTLAKEWEAPDLRFARPEELEAILGVKAGSVTPFALLNDSERKVSVFFDKKMFSYTQIGLHPLRNDKTLLVAPLDVEKFVAALGYQVRFL